MRNYLQWAGLSLALILASHQACAAGGYHHEWQRYHHHQRVYHQQYL
ncbi:Uncharacterised protein [Edwardsiella tarda]|nr:Uncharacterised protein [Edwardsiella tarda]